VYLNLFLGMVQRYHKLFRELRRDHESFLKILDVPVKSNLGRLGDSTFLPWSALLLLFLPKNNDV
jgi:hypothetical protein